MRCPQASGANRPRSCGPSTLNVIYVSRGRGCPLSTIAARHRHKITANRIQSRNILKTKDLPRSFQCHFGKLAWLSRQGKTRYCGDKLLRLNDFDINYVRPPENLFLGPSGKAEIGTVFIPMRDIQAAIEDRLHLYVWGRATYDDMFEGSKPHFFEFCQRLQVTGEAPGSIDVSFTQFGLSNGSDEDRRLPAEAA